jgi:RNA-binding protein
VTVPPKISTRARAHLRSLAHHLEPVSQIGHDGLTEALIESIAVLLERHELIKVKVGQGYEGDRREAAREIAAKLGADLTQIIGRVIVLYRPRSKRDPKRPPIVLPDGP